MSSTTHTFRDKVVIVTGAARGLGRDYALYLGREGARIVLADIAGAQTSLDAVLGEGGIAIDCVVDVTDRVSVAAMIEMTQDAYGGLDVLINNAGMWRGLAEAGLLDCPAELWQAAWDVNLTGSLFCYQAAVPLMRERGGGRIINVSSMSSDTGMDAYALSKAALEHMTRGMAREVGAYGITVNCIAPGICAFEGAKAALPGLQAIVESNPIRRAGSSRDLFGAIRYLCSSDASWVTGETLRVDGGTTTR